MSSIGIGGFTPSLQEVLSALQQSAQTQLASASAHEANVQFPNTVAVYRFVADSLQP